MIIFGLRSKSLGGARIPARCSFCLQEGVALGAEQRYFHLYWIPVFPLPKQLVSVCGHCQKVTEEKAFDANVKMHSDQLRVTLRTPFYLWVGALLIASFVAFAVYEGRERAAVTDAQASGVEL
jgi:hypothetical protein